MASANAKAKFLRVAPRKMRLVADMVRGRTVAEARDILQFTPRGAAPVLRKVLESAVANAENSAAERRERIDADEMVITQLLVDGGLTIKRMQPRARGRRCLIRKRTSHVKLIIADREEQRAAAQANG
jgi:large subunit ribosomal protein L22